MDKPPIDFDEPEPPYDVLAQRDELLEALHSLGAYKTPDGATYSLTNIRAAMRDM